MKQILISRRAFLAATTATGMIALTGCGLGESDLPLPGAGEDAARGLVAYRLSTKGKRASRAAKRHAANKLFATSAAADANRAHPGDKSAIVQVDVSQAAWDRYFGQGNEVFDLRCTELGAKFAKKLAANPAPLPVPVYAAADGVITATPTAQIARALQQEWGIALPSGRPIDLVWIVLPAITTLGQYTVELTGPCPDPVPFEVDLVRNDLCTAAVASLQAIQAANVKVGAKVGEQGKLFGSVTVVQLADALTKSGQQVDRKQLRIIDEPIKTIGTYQAEYTTACSVKGLFSFEVVEE